MKVLWTDTGDNSRVGNYSLSSEMRIVVARWHTRDGEPFTYYLSVFIIDGFNTTDTLFGEMFKAGWRFDSRGRGSCWDFLMSTHANDPVEVRRKLDGIIPDLEHKEDESWTLFNPLI